MADQAQILVRESQGKRETALLKDGKLWEYECIGQEEGSLVGTVFLGKVERVLPDIKAAFVNIGRSLNGFLPLRESDSYHACNGKAPLITDNDVIVQVKKDEKGGKGAYLTRDITLVGQYQLLLPMSRFVGVSKRIEDPHDREAAKELGHCITKDRFGIIVRQAALSARFTDVLVETNELYLRFMMAIQYASTTKAPAVLMQDEPLFVRLYRDYCARYAMQLYLPLRLKAETDIAATACTELEMDAQWAGNHIDRQIREALGRKVMLSGGASLVIDEREALHTIDVNSGGNVQADDGKSLALAQNLAAIPEIARQIRLRNLSGILLIDFIDMDTTAEREQVAAALETALVDDRTKTVLHGFTSLGLMELTRKRTGQTLREMLTTPCKHCGATGYSIQP